MERRMEGKVVLVTGGAVRVGRAIAEALGKAGAAVAVHYHRSAAQAQAVVRALQVDGNRARAFQADLSDPATPEDLVHRVEEELGPLAAVVNSAAVFARKPFLESSPEHLEAQWALNARAPYLLAQAAARRMVPRGGGDLVNVVDVGGVLSFWRNYAAYCMTKAALAALTRCLALELAPALRVNAVAPGTVLPPDDMDEQTRERLRSRIPQGRFGTPEEVAEAVLFLLTGPRHVTGQILAVDGASSLERAGR